ncbi:hypothetical protein CASFOL_033090 [Castilleja foliolosa]|uniref:KIB1-4 beta-propeller domain-containing protein n=1 Tax=Castilleja foliolosa TaxID=1961234 RepID=A0ABD3C489_9LAMI
MSPPFLLLRSIFPRSSNYLISKSLASFQSSSSLFRPMSTAVAQSELLSNIQNSPPWLMLPPAFDGGAMSHNFYSLAENKVISLAGTGEKEITDLMSNSKPENHRVLRGSSHGWLALFDRRNLDFFLYNPISKRHIKLPPIHNLPLFPSHDCRSVTKVILSCSPDEDYENCRAIMMYNCSNLAFCCPGRSHEWIRFGRYPDGYDEIVYSDKHQLLFGLTNCDDYLETWDLRDLSSPRMVMSHDSYSEDYSEEEEDQVLENFCIPVDHLVVADNHLLFVTRYLMEHVGSDGSYVDYYGEHERSRNCPHVTVDFEVYKYDHEKKDFRYEDSLDDLALFIGLESDTVALPASHFTGVKPNSIYFTDTIGTGYWFGKDEDAPFGGHDIGIFNYQDKTISSCYYPCDVKSIQRILPSPIWFFPSSSI